MLLVALGIPCCLSFSEGIFVSGDVIPAAVFLTV